jgi:hypothetical protein
MDGARSGLQEADEHLKHAISALGKAIGVPKDRRDDLELLKEQIVDIRQQLAFLSSEIVPGPGNRA